MRVWVDQDLCTGDGLCTDHCPDVFVLLEDGLSYVRDITGSPRNDPGGRLSMVTVPVRRVDQAIAAALDCPGECIFLEEDEIDDADDGDIAFAEVVDRSDEC
jgi:ferredoxin